MFADVVVVVVGNVECCPWLDTDLLAKVGDNVVAFLGPGV